MVVRRTSYPQVDPRAGGLMTRAVAVVPRGLAIEEAARVARQRRARLVIARLGTGWGAATLDTLARALSLELGRAALDTVLWGAPGLDADVPEVSVRRRLGPATPFVVVLAAGRPVGAVLVEPGMSRPLPRAATAELGRLDAATGDLLRAAGRLAAESGWRLATVGGLVRDLLRGRLAARPRDLDLAVEGDARLLARRLGRAFGGRVREHEAFLTATVTLPDGRGLDLATARRERYRRPGALPLVEPATLEEDLARRDFTVNALAVRIDEAAWGEVLDPTGGLADLARGRIRVLHPLSFVEDPTRVFRAGRFAERLGFRLEPSTRRLLAAAAGLGAYEALSGDRLLAELEAILGEPRPSAVLARLGRAGAFRLIVPGYRFPAEAAARLARVAGCRRGVPFADGTLAGLCLLALGAHLSAGEAETWVTRWGVPAPLRAAITRARDEAPELAARLARAPGVEAAYAALRGMPELTAAWTGIVARGARARRYVRAHLARWRRLPPLLGGDDLKALGLVPGPRFGALLEGVRTAQVAGRLRSREDAVAWVRGRLAGNGSDPSPKGG
jgi:tRNA nucleotidyltransferase (CCA-adding enzyme)